MKKNIYVLGNPYIKTDNLPIKLLPKLKKLMPDFNFIHIDPAEEFPKKEKNLIIIDSVWGINTVACFNDLNAWNISPRNTVHDFDLPVSLGILKKLGKIKKVTVIGIPLGEKSDIILFQIKHLLQKLKVGHNCFN